MSVIMYLKFGSKTGRTKLLQWFCPFLYMAYYPSQIKEIVFLVVQQVLYLLSCAVFMIQ